MDEIHNFINVSCITAYVLSMVLVLKSVHIILQYMRGEIVFIRPWYTDFRYPVVPNRSNSTHTVVFCYLCIIFCQSKSFRGKLTVLTLVTQMWLNFSIYGPFQEIDQPFNQLIRNAFRFNRFVYLTIIEQCLTDGVESDNANVSTLTLLGLVLYITGFSLKRHYDIHFLTAHRDESAHLAPSEGYLFHYITCPHLLCRSIEWVGIAIMSGSSVAYSYALFISCFHFVNAQGWHRRFVLQNIGTIHGRNAFFPGTFYDGELN